MENGERVMMLFEGVCPSCKGDDAVVVVTEVSGRPGFLQDFTFIGDHTVKPWDELNEAEERRWDPDWQRDPCDGVVEFKCGGCGAPHEAYHNEFGDWS